MADHGVVDEARLLATASTARHRHCGIVLARVWTWLADEQA
jgi:hypothetical protein